MCVLFCVFNGTLMTRMLRMTADFFFLFFCNFSPFCHLHPQG